MLQLKRGDVDVEKWNEVIRKINDMFLWKNYTEGTNFKMQELVSEEDSIGSLKEAEKRGFTWDVSKIKLPGQK